LELDILIGLSMERHRDYACSSCRIKPIS
jgi:hypothetical protein